MKFVYVITTNGNDLFEKLTVVSILSLRYFNKLASVFLLIDIQSFECLINSSSILLSLSDQIIPVKTPDGSHNFKNRWIKTQVALFIEPPFLFLDSDTLIRGSLKNIFEVRSHLALALNHSQKDIDNQIAESDCEIFAEMRWDLPRDRYFNGGVILYADKIKSKIFSKCWHSNWIKSYHKTKSFKDQPSLNYTLKKFEVEILDAKFNAQFYNNPSSFRNAVIWHYYTINLPYSTDYFKLIDRLYFPNWENEIIRIVKAFHPSINKGLIGKYLVYRITRNFTINKLGYRLMSTNSIPKQFQILFHFLKNRS